MIRVSNLTVSFGAVQALKDVSFEAATGAVTAVLGANGAGKTTLLRTISGLNKAASGSIYLGSDEITGERTEGIARRGLGHVPEGRGVIAEFTVEENLRLGAITTKVDLASGLEEQYARVPVLGERRKQHASTLSGGERQMLAMARALIAKPKVLLLDEPSLGLAPLVTQDLMSTIGDLCASGELSVILVEQNAKSALRVAQHAVVLHLGSVVADATAEEIASNDQLRQYYLGMAS
jgi:branched-chain amino acid transport system ATP-binding protein